MSTPTAPLSPATPGILAALQAALPELEGIAALFVPGGQAVLAGLTLVQVFNLVNGLVNEAPAALDFVASIKNWAAGGTPPTAAQWAVLDANFDKADAALAAADAAVIAGHTPI